MTLVQPANFMRLFWWQAVKKNDTAPAPATGALGGPFKPFLA
jgi:hypothetical protein